MTRGLPETYRNGMRGSSGCRDEAGRLLAGNCCIHAKRYWHAGRSSHVSCYANCGWPGKARHGLFSVTAHRLKY